MINTFQYFNMKKIFNLKVYVLDTKIGILNVKNNNTDPIKVYTVR